MSNLYAERDILEQGKHYSQHTSAMTSEGLHSKSDIAAELAHRDIEIERLQARVAELYDFIKYAQVDSGVCMCGDDIKDHNQASGHSSVDVWDHAVEQINKEGSSEAFILRKQAEAVQASRQEGEPIGFLQSSGVSQLSGGHPAKLYPIGATPSPFESSTLVYTHPASSDEWIKCSERLPKESDGDCHGIVWVYNKGLSWVEISDLEDVKFISDYTHWMPTNLVRPEPPKQEEGQ